MRAKEWKGYDATTKTTTDTTPSSLWDESKFDLLGNSRSSRHLPTAPDSQLLEFLARRSDQKKQTLFSRQMPTNPVAGEKSVPMTFGDGTRVHVRIRKETDIIILEEKASSASSSRQHYALGVSMNVLFERVNTIRRKKEHERQRLLNRNLSGDKAESGDEQLTADEEKDDERKTKPTSSKADYQLWVDKHAPSSFAHLLSDERTNREVIRALRAWDPYVFRRDPPPRPDMGFGNRNTNGAVDAQKDADAKESSTNTKTSKDRRPDESSRVILLSGPPGVGKTTLAHIVARHAGYRPLEVNGSDDRSSSVLTDLVVRAMESTSLNMLKGNGPDAKARPNCLILDEIDGVEKGAVQSLVDIIRAEIPPKGTKNKSRIPYLRRPIIFICNNKFAPALRPLLPFAKQFNVSSPSSTRLVARLHSVLSSENMSVFGGSSLLHQLVTATCGDIRSCLYTLQFASYRAKSRSGGDALQDDSAVADISSALNSALNGDGMKDKRNDVAGTITTIFRKEKEKKLGGSTSGAGRYKRPSADRVLDSVEVRLC